MTESLCDVCYHDKSEHGEYCSAEVVVSDDEDTWDYYNCDCTGYVPEVED